MPTTLIDQVLDSPRMMLYLDQLTARARDEAEARKRYRANLKPGGPRVEFINGKEVRHVPALRGHNKTAERSYLALHAIATARKLGEVGHENYLVELTRNDVIPDVLFWPADVVATLDDNTFYHPPPALIVEVLSPSTEARDRGVKFDDYAAHGVREYWLVDVTARTVEQYVLRDGEYVLLGRHGVGDTIRCPTLADAELPAAALFDDAASQAFLDRVRPAAQQPPA